jgi:ParB-like chromosome segregation protein Spo0J
MKEVPVIVLRHLSEAQKRALVIADNQLALNAGWDETALHAELEALRDADYDLGLIGFDDHTPPAGDQRRGLDTVEGHG